jgi:penicillin-binding protein-related factor A (putative recombinase)
VGKEVVARANKGKKFEDVIKESFLKVPDVSIDRLRDAPRKLKGVDNPSDFIVYKYPHEVYVECKSHKGNTLPFSCIREEQIRGMLDKALIPGVIAGVIIWYIDRDITVWLSIDVIVTMMEFGYKSVNIKDLSKIPHTIITGKKKRVYFDYEMDSFLRRLYGEN